MLLRNELGMVVPIGDRGQPEFNHIRPQPGLKGAAGWPTFAPGFGANVGTLCGYFESTENASRMFPAMALV